MNHVLLLIPLLLAVSIPVAFGETVETKGENYDLIEDFTLGEATWVSHPDRIMNGQWENYALTDSEDKVIFNSNSVGSLIYDKNSCSYSIYGNGYNGEQIIPSVSAVATYLNEGTWQNMEVNDSSCDVTVTQNEDSVFLTSTKILNEDVSTFNSVNGTNVITTIQKEKFVQELKLDIQNGFKETFKVWNVDDQQLGISQTVHTSEEIVIGDNTINIAELNGQSFDRQFIVDNQAEILQLTDKINYDFDEGLNSLSNVNIIHESGFLSNTYKVNLDYANGDFVGYLEIDPTFGYNSVGSNYNIVRGLTTVNGSVCDGTYNSPPTYVNGYGLGGSGFIIKMTASGDADFCQANISKWDVTSIPDTAIISDIKLKYVVDLVAGTSPTCDLQSIESDPATLSNSQLWTDVYDGTNFANAFACGSVGTHIQTLNSASHSDLENNLSSDWWALGFVEDSLTRTSSQRQINTQSNANTLEVTYTIPTAPTAPQTLTTSQSTANEIILNWLAPSSSGGVSITNYEIWLNGNLIDTIGNVLTYTDTISGSEIGSGLTYSVKAVNSIGASPASNNSFITAWDVPDAPVSFQAVTGSPITMTWVTPNSDDVITAYKIYRDGVLIDTRGSSPNSYTDNTTVSGNSYVYSATALSAVGEGPLSSSSTATAGISWNPPGSVNAIISDVNNFPYVIDVSWSASNQGSGTGVLTGYELWRTNGANTVLVATLGTGITYSDTVSLANTNFEYFVKSTSTHGTSGSSPNSNTVTTPTIPGTINDLAGSVISDTKINLSFSIPNNGGSNIIDYDILKDGVTIATVTSNSYSSTGLTPNTQYTFEVFSRNNVGFSLISNQAIETTYLSVGGSITITTDTQGATTELTFAPSGVTGTPTPNFNLFTLKEGVNVIASGITSPYYLAHDNFNSNTYTVTSADNTHWNNPTITGSSTVQSDYSPSWNTANVSYNYTRTSGVMDLMVNKDNSQNTWDASCNYRTTSEVMDDQLGITSNHTGVWYVSESQTLADIDTVYVSCVDGEDALFSFTSFGPNRLGGGIAQLDDFFGGMTGTPVALIFVLLVAGLFTGRTAPTGILVMLALIGVLGFIGLLTLDEAVWGFLLLAGVLGIFLGKRFL